MSGLTLPAVHIPTGDAGRPCDECREERRTGPALRAGPPAGASWMPLQGRRNLVCAPIPIQDSFILMKERCEASTRLLEFRGDLSLYSGPDHLQLVFYL